MSYKDITRPASTAYTSCPHIKTSGTTQYCGLAEQAVRERDEEIARLRDALVMIKGVRITVGGVEQSESYNAGWLRELADEALNGINPRTGKKA